MNYYLKLTFLLYALIFINSGIFSQIATAPSGSGTLNDPYLIENGENLYWVTQNSGSWSSYFSQTNPIVFTGMNAWNGGAGWSPIGNVTTLFTGVYNGNGFDV